MLAGATGYILKDSQENLLTSIRLLRGGGSPRFTYSRPLVFCVRFTPGQSRSRYRPNVIPHRQPVLVGRPVHQHADDGRVLLSQRESEIIMLLAKGHFFL